MTINLGYAVSTGIFFIFFVVAIAAQVASKTFYRFLYWAAIVTATTVGTTMADFADRSLGIGYVGGSLILFIMLMSVMGLWRYSVGSISFDNLSSPKAEVFYWVTILASSTLGTALGDFLAESSGLGYEGGALFFSTGLALIALAYFTTKVSHTLLFWMAFILTRPLGATVGDILTKPIAHGGLNLSRICSSAALAVFMIGCILLTSREAGKHPAKHS